jgi:hypothetical protein
LTGGNFNGSTGVTWSVISTSANTSGTIVARDNSGNFAAGTVSAYLNGNAATATLAYSTSGSIYAGAGLTGTTFNGSTGVTWSVISTSANISGTIVSRDNSGNFAAGVITASLAGNATTATTANATAGSHVAGTGLSGATFNGSAGTTTWYVISTTAPTAGIVSRDTFGNMYANVVVASLSGNATTATTATTANATVGSLITGAGLQGTSFNGSTNYTWSVISTSANVSGTIVARDTSGNFSANVIFASLSGNATTATSAGYVTNSIYPGTGLSGSSFNGNGAVTWSVISTSANTSNVIVVRDASGNFSAGTISATLSGTATKVSNQHIAGTGLSGNNFDGSNQITWSVISTSANVSGTIVARDISGSFAANVITASRIVATSLSNTDPGGYFNLNGLSMSNLQTLNLTSTGTLNTNTIAGTTATSAITIGSVTNPLTLAGVTNPIIIGGALSDETTVFPAVTNGSPLANFLTMLVPFNFRISSANMPLFSLTSGPATTITMDILLNGSTIYSIQPTISNNGGTADLSTLTSRAVSPQTTPGQLLNDPTIINQYSTLQAILYTCPANNANTGLKVYIYNS